MKYFIVNLTYEVPFERVAEVVGEHRAFLDMGYENGSFLASGPQNPRVGGLLIARAESREALMALLKDDPVQTKGIVSYHVTEFEPVKRHPEFGAFFAA